MQPTKLVQLMIMLALSSVFAAGNAQVNPLAKYDPVWKNAKYEHCNTAKKISYLSPAEKEIIFVLNMVRAYPQQFLKTVIRKWPDIMEMPYLKTNSYYTSLLEDMQPLTALPILTFDSLLYVSAHCHALSSGKEGYLGHERITEECEALEKFYGECCSYGTRDPVTMIVRLLIDEDVPSLGHRIICLKANYKTIGVSMQQHNTYGVNTVLDFGF